MNEKMFEIMKNKPGFIAALDQSGGSSSKTLKNYGWVSEDNNDKPYIAYLPFDTPYIQTKARLRLKQIGVEKLLLKYNIKKSSERFS